MKKVNVVAAVISRNGRFLLGKRAGGERSAPLHWSPICGQVEKDETEQAAIERECREELGVRAKAQRKVAEFDVDDGAARLHWWTVSLIEGEPQVSNDEHTELKWTSLSEMDSLSPMRPADRAVFDKLSLN